MPDEESPEAEWECVCLVGPQSCRFTASKVTPHENEPHGPIYGCRDMQVFAGFGRGVGGETALRMACFERTKNLPSGKTDCKDACSSF